MNHKPFPKIRIPLLLLLGVAAALAGCVTPTPTTPVADSEKDPLEYPVAESIGQIIFVDPEGNLALIRVRTSSTRPAPVMTVRNHALVTTASLEPTRFQRGRTLGARILSGLPNVGDEVVPGAPTDTLDPFEPRTAEPISPPRAKPVEIAKPTEPPPKPVKESVSDRVPAAPTGKPPTVTRGSFSTEVTIRPPEKP